MSLFRTSTSARVLDLLPQTMMPAKVPGVVGFIFDIIIVRLDLPNMKIDDVSKLTVDVKFNKNDIKITSSHINVNEFKTGRSYEFMENPIVLKEQLFKNPLECKVSYDGKTIGNCDFIWPDRFLNGITDCAGELIHSDEADIKNAGKKIGTMEITVRLQVKCHEFDENLAVKPQTDLCNPNDIIIDPNDIQFVVKEDKIHHNLCDCAQVGIIPSKDSRESINPTILDLSTFRAVNGKTVANTDIFKQLDKGCCKLKKTSDEYQQIIESLMGKAKDPPFCLKSQKQQHPTCISKFHQQTTPVDCVSGSSFPSCCSSDSFNSCRCLSDDDTDNIMECPKDKKIEKPTKRYCPLCRENITWLPKFVNCPKCGFKPIEYPPEKPYNDKLTADDIIRKYLNKKSHDPIEPKEATSIYHQQNGNQCRCTCSNNKICAYCRIKKVCQDIFQPPIKDKLECGKCEAKSSDMFNVCKASSSDCKPYLAKVFQEFRDIYNLRETKQNFAETKDSKQNLTDCDCVSSPQDNQPTDLKEHKYAAIKNSRRHRNITNERKRYLVKNFQKQETPCKGEVFDYRSKRKYPATKIGHKTCINGFAGRKNVPRNMGWLWSVEATGIRAGWKPGAIRKPINVLMKHFLNQNQCSCNVLKRKEDIKKDDAGNNNAKNPTLHICKKNGVYYITLRPLENAVALEECSNPYVDMKPIKFKITKHPLLVKMRNIKQCLKAMGFPKCTCHKPISHCCCRSFLEKKRLEYQCHKECKKRELPACTDRLVLSDTSDSEAEFDFGVSPPAGFGHPDRYHKRRRKVSTGTQYVKNDWNITPENSKTSSKYVKLYNCAVGERFGKSFSPYGFRGYAPGALPVQTPYVSSGLKGGAGDGGFGGKGARSGLSDPGGFGAKVKHVSKARPGGFGGRPVVRGGLSASSGKPVANMDPKAYVGADGKFNMIKYLEIINSYKPSPAEIAERKKQKLALLKGTNPPLLCMVDRRGKPPNPCPPCASYNCDTVCLRDNRIC